MDCKGNSDEVLGRNEEQGVANRNKGHLCYKVIENLVTSCPCPKILLKKAEYKSNELRGSSNVTIREAEKCSLAEGARDEKDLASSALHSFFLLPKSGPSLPF